MQPSGAPLLVKLALAAFKSGLVPSQWHRGVWRRVTLRCKGARFAHVLRLGASRFRLPVSVGVNDQLVLDGLHRYEEEVFTALHRTLPAPRPVILDVGANLGQYALRLKALRREAEIHAFEPFPHLAGLLRELSQLNHWHDVRVSPLLVGEAAGIGFLHHDGQATDTASTVAGFQPGNRHFLEVERTTLDDYVQRAGLSRIDLIKIDVEGGELEVIQGAMRTLARYRPLVLVELLWTQNPDHLARQQRVIALLRGAGYHFHLIRPDGALEHQIAPQPDPGYRLLNFLVSPEPLPTGAPIACSI